MCHAHNTQRIPPYPLRLIKVGSNTHSKTGGKYKSPPKISANSKGGLFVGSLGSELLLPLN